VGQHEEIHEDVGEGDLVLERLQHGNDGRGQLVQSEHDFFWEGVVQPEHGVSRSAGARQPTEGQLVAPQDSGALEGQGIQLLGCCDVVG